MVGSTVVTAIAAPIINLLITLLATHNYRRRLMNKAVTLRDKLPYDFDLLWDVKNEEQVERIAKYEGDCSDAEPHDLVDLYLKFDMSMPPELASWYRTSQEIKGDKMTPDISGSIMADKLKKEGLMSTPLAICVALPLCVVLTIVCLPLLCFQPVSPFGLNHNSAYKRHGWFAWRPVITKQRKFIWLRTVTRECVGCPSGYFWKYYG